MQSIQKKNVLVTGAGRGIGKRLALGFAGQGARLGLIARSKTELDLTQLEIEHGGGTAIRLRADVVHFAQIRAAVERMRAAFGEIDILICGAGILGPIGPMWSCDPKAWAATIETNLLGVMNTCRAVLPSMVERRSGKILVLGGGGTMRPRPNFSAYAASKAAVVRFVETMAEEAADYNVQINVLGPGSTYTHMTDEILRAGERAGERDLEEALQVRRNGGVSPDRQIELALFLASEEANHISGRLIHIRDNWKRLRHADLHPEVYTLRRVRRV